MKVVLLGSGNVGTHLGKALKHAGFEIVQVWSRTLANAEKLAEILGSTATDSFEHLSTDADIYILAVSDAAIPEVSAGFPFKNSLIAHTSGTTDLGVIAAASSKTGVFYPVQTFSKQREVDFKDIPIVVEGNTPEVEATLLALAKSVSHKVEVLDSEKRLTLHVAAVFSCNFSNHLYTMANEVLSEKKLDFGLIRPLIAETAAKVQRFFPQDVQTGPAVRNDQLTVNKHIAYLEEKPELQDLYEKLSQSIINFYQKH